MNPENQSVSPEHPLSAPEGDGESGVRLSHVGLHAYRLAAPEAGNPRERIFAEAWARENERGYAPTLAHLLSDGRTADPFSGFTGKLLTPYDQRAATIAATIIQWLGSNVGLSFVEECLSKAGFRLVRKE